MESGPIEKTDEMIGSDLGYNYLRMIRFPYPIYRGEALAVMVQKFA